MPVKRPARFHAILHAKLTERYPATVARLTLGMGGDHDHGLPLALSCN